MTLIRPDVKIRLLKRIDSILGVPLACLMPAPRLQPGVQVRSILIIRPGGIGDALLLAPALGALRNKYADAVITVLAEQRNAGGFALIPTVDKLLLYDRTADLLRLFLSRYDLIIDTEQWHRMSAVIARLIPSALKIGFATNQRGRLFTHAVPYSQDKYEAQSFLDLLEPLTTQTSFDRSSIFLTVPESARKEIAPFFESFPHPYIAVFPGASVRERRWGGDRFKALAQRLATSGIPVVVIGGKEDYQTGEAIVSGSDSLNLAGKISIAGTAAVIDGARMLVSGDSGVLHMGAGLGIPTVSLFGAGIAKKWSPHGAMHRVLNRNLFCSPCTLFGTTPVCPYSVRCLEEITVDMVNEAVAVLLNI